MPKQLVSGVVEHDRERRRLPTRCSLCDNELAPLAWKLLHRSDRFCSRQCADARRVELFFEAEELRRRRGW